MRLSSTTAAIAGLLGVTTALACAAEMPLRMTGLAADYCANAEVLKATIENTSLTALFVSVSVDRRLSSGEWEEYVADIFAGEPFPRKVTSLRLLAGQSRALEWHPPKRPTGDPLADGTYRVVAYATRSHGVQGQRHVLAEFSVSKKGCGRSLGP